MTDQDMKKQDYTFARHFNGELKYDEHGQIIWINNKELGRLPFLDVRGWGHLKNQFHNADDAAKFQDDIGRWVTETLSKELNRMKNK